MHTLRLLASWALAVFLIFMFVQATLWPIGTPPEGMVKLYDAPGQNIAFQTMANNTGIALLEPTGRVVVAVLELFAAFLILIPPFRKTGAGLAVLILAAAAAAHLLPDVLGQELPMSLAPGETANDGGRMFAMVIAMLAASLLLFAVHPRKRKLFE